MSHALTEQSTKQRVLRAIAALGIAAALLLAVGTSTADAQPSPDFQLTVSVDAWSPALDFTFAGNGAVFVLSDGESRTVALPTNTPIEIGMFPLPEDSYINRAPCTGTPGLAVDAEGTITGSVPAGATVRCDYQILKKTPLTMTVVMDAGADASTAFDFTYRPNPRFAFPGFSLSSGESKTFETTNGAFMKLIAFAESGWQYTGGFCTGDDAALFLNIDELAIFEGTLLQGVTDVTCTVTAERTEVVAEGIYPTVTCLAGNGRIDLNVLNNDSAPHVYGVKIGNLSRRAATVAAGDWWRSPVTGRPDGVLAIVVDFDGTVILDTTVQVRCDGPDGGVSEPEIQILNACRSGLGFVAWQFANPTAQNRSYVIEFEGLVNRSTSAGPHGAAVRAVSGRPDGTYAYAIRTPSGTTQHSVTVDCS